MEVLTKLFSSQKFLVLLASTIGVLITKIFKVQVDRATIMEFVILIGSYLVGQGIGDMGKSAAKVTAIASLANLNPSISTSHEQAKTVEAIKSV
jgi:hypothetical protein